MPILSDDLKAQLKQRLAEDLRGPVEIRLRTRPSTGALFIPGDASCETCDACREIAEGVAEASPLVSLVVTEDRSVTAPIIEIAPPGEPARITFEGLPGGYEFASLLDAIERVSASDPGLSAETREALGALDEDVELMVFVTPT